MSKSTQSLQDTIWEAMILSSAFVVAAFIFIGSIS